ncbi:MAG: BCAM0308 family protein [Methylotenera sp.]|uniref:BCAM0308 family protein n=1 Tax=Methylotenera sp. TaxID=2051956 RepID=UPI0027286722|nr:BCAM0308 family protein [Methylotenera sp.]MDO9392882.1 BCAM0308 family protein [Methylotenera sp.]
MSINKTPTGNHTIGHDRPLFEQDIDSYKAKEKLSEPTVCPQCGAVYHAGRWQWIEPPSNADSQTCPACHRIKDNFPAGFVTLEGPFFNTHSEEIKHLIQNHALHERVEHPLKRIIAIENQAIGNHQGSSMLVTTTDTHLARGIGEAVRHAYQGELKVNHVSGENTVRVQWSR